MFNTQCEPDRTRRPEAEILEDVAERVATECLRVCPRLPRTLDGKDCAVTGGLLPIVHCGFTDCDWSLKLADMPTDNEKRIEPALEETFRRAVDHPCDQRLREHIMSEHRSCLSDRATPIHWLPSDDSLLWDIYKAALSFRERECIPVAGPSIDRRAFQYTSYVYSDARIRSLICFCCAQIK